MQIALNSQRALFFEMENIIGAISKHLKASERPEQTLTAITTIIKSSMRLLKDAESSSKVAYSQLLSSSKPSDNIEIMNSHFPDWKSSIKLSGQEIFDLEISLSDLLSSLLSQSSQNLPGKIRDSCTKLLKLGIQLPLTSNDPSSDVFTHNEKKIILMNIKSSVKNDVKEIIRRVGNERKNMLIEQELMRKELEGKISDLNEFERNLQDLRKEIGDKGSVVKETFKNKLVRPFDEILSVFNNIEQGSALQLFVVFKKNAEKIKEFIEYFMGFQF